MVLFFLDQEILGNVGIHKIAEHYWFQEFGWNKKQYDILSKEGAVRKLHFKYLCHRLYTIKIIVHVLGEACVTRPLVKEWQI